MLGVAVVTGGPCDRSAVSEAGSGRDEVREVAWARWVFLWRREEATSRFERRSNAVWLEFCKCPSVAVRAAGGEHGRRAYLVAGAGTLPAVRRPGCREAAAAERSGSGCAWEDAGGLLMNWARGESAGCRRGLAEQSGCVGIAVSRWGGKATEAVRRLPRNWGFLLQPAE